MSVIVTSNDINVNVTTSPITVTTGTLSALWGNITGSLSNQTDLQAALNLKATIASPTFTGTPASTTPTTPDNSTRISTTAFVKAQGYLTPASGALAYQPLSATLTSLSSLTAPTGPLIVGSTDTQTLTNKTLTAPVIATIVNTGVLTLPTTTDTLVGRATTDTLTNKTLTSPVVASVYNAGTITLPSGTRTLVARDTTDTLTNKSIDLSSNTLTATSAQLRTAVSDETGTGALVFAGSPTLTGVPLAPTAAVDTSTTQLATTAFVVAQGYDRSSISIKATDQSVTSSTVLVDCTDISIAVSANANYIISLGIIVDISTGANQCSAKMVFPSGASTAETWTISNASALYSGSNLLSSQESIVLLSAPSKTSIHETFLLKVGSTAGTVKLQFTQGTSNGNTVTVKADSWIRKTPVS